MAKKPAKTSKTITPRKTAVARKAIEPDEHRDKQRLNDPSVELIHADSEPKEPRKPYAINPHREPSLNNVSKTQQSSEQTAEIKDQKEIKTESLNEFWERFRLSPIEGEHPVFTNIWWMTLLTLGPLGFRLILLIIYEVIAIRTTQQNFTGTLAILELQDFAFTYFSLSLFFGGFIFCRYWYPTIRHAFESLLHNEVLRDQNGKRISEAEFHSFLANYRKELHSRKRNILPIVSSLLALGYSLYYTNTRGAFWDLTDPSNPLTVISYVLDFLRWIVAPVVFSYVVMMWLWILAVTTKAIMELTPRFQIYVQPLHSDRVGGLKKLGDLCSYVGLIIIVIITPLTVLTFQRTIISMQIPRCGTEIQQFINGQMNMSQDRLIDCLYYVTSNVPGSSRAVFSDSVAEALNHGHTLKELAKNSYSGAPGAFLWETVSANYAVYYAWDFIFLFVLVFVFFVVIKPLSEIHESMVEYKRKREYETNRHISELFDEMTTLINKNKLDEADKAKTNIKFLNDELNEIQKYPSWPISALPVLRSYLTSSLITALLTYIISLLKLAVSAEASSVLNEAIKSIFDH